MSSAGSDLTAILARASEKSRAALSAAEDEAAAWLEAVRSGALSKVDYCVTCDGGPPLEDNHVGGRTHGDLAVPMCIPDHRRFSERQGAWDPRWTAGPRSPELDEAFPLLGLYELLLLRAERVARSKSGAYLALAESVREQYARAARRTV